MYCSERGEIEEAIKNLKKGKAPDIDSITAEMQKYGGCLVEDVANM